MGANPADSPGKFFNEAFLRKQLERCRKDVFFLQIGANDGITSDPLNRFIREYGWNGILVEPLPDLFEQLLKTYAGRPGLSFEQVAIADHDGVCRLYRVPPEAVGRAGLPDYSLSIASLYREKNRLAEPAFQDHIVSQEVSCLTLPSLLKKHAVKRIDILQIDAEGADFMILRQLDLTRYLPLVINIEFKNLTTDEQEQCRALLVSSGYHLHQYGIDLLAVHQNMLAA